MTRSVVYSPAAQQQLTDLYHWIATSSGFPDRAAGFVFEVIDYCDGLATFPLIGVARDDLRTGLRILGFRRRVTIAFAVTEDSVEILGIYYGGRDYESLISTDVGGNS